MQAFNKSFFTLFKTGIRVPSMTSVSTYSFSAEGGKKEGGAAKKGGEKKPADAKVFFPLIFVLF